MDVAYLSKVLSSVFIWFMCHQVDVDRADLLYQMTLDASLSNDHEDCKIVIINYYK